MKRDLAGVGGQWRMRARDGGSGRGMDSGGLGCGNGSETGSVVEDEGKQKHQPVLIPASQGLQG